MSASPEAQLEIAANPEALARRVADWLLAMATAKDGAFAVSLSGGTTPRRLYECLAASPYREAFPWSRIHWFWGDERFVPHDDTRSNYRMVWEAMLSRVPVRATHIHAVPTEGLDAKAAARAYERELKIFYGAERLDPVQPLFDVVLLGLGTDGHTASLFPDMPVLEEHERWVAAVAGPQPETRITMTYPLLESTRVAAFLVEGKEKKTVFSRLLSGACDFPAARLRPAGKLYFFADMAATGGKKLG